MKNPIPLIEGKLLNAVKANKDYSCPKCKLVHNSDESYVVDGIEFPQYYNEIEGGDMDGSYHDWDEIHKCEKCKTEYWFKNGAF